MTYDAIGNMLTKGSTTYTWTQGRKLASVQNGKSIQYFYDHTGNRTRKVVDGVTTQFRYAGDLLVSERTGSEKNLWYRYDSAGNVISVTYDSNIYMYIRNVQNDVIALIDRYGNTAVRYTYDSWGRVMSIDGSMKDSLGERNPFRYRGYYYDTETGLYYLKNRYYDPEIRRFISTDSIDVLEVQNDLYDKNLYAYCDNNPVMRKDGNGQVWTAAMITVGIMAVGGIIGGVIGAVSSAITQDVFTGTINWKSVAVAGGTGFVSGAIAASPLGSVWQVGLGAGVGATSYAIDCKVNKKPVVVNELAIATLGGGFSGFIGGSGANQNMTLTRTVQTSIKTTNRMLTRKCTTYAAKQITSTKAWRNNVLTVNAMGSSARFAAGTGISSAIAGAWSTVKGWFSKLFK